MAHEISEVSGRAEAWSSGTVPWHGLGEVSPEPVSITQAIRLAGLDWIVEQQSLHLPNGNEIPDKIANVRTGFRGVEPYTVYLGTVSKGYKIFQNAEMGNFARSLLGDGPVAHTAGAIRDGRRVWLLTKVDGTIHLANGEHIKDYLLFANSHDGTMRFQTIWTGVRVVCNNTLTRALGSSLSGFRALHKGDLAGRVEEAAGVLGIALQKREEIKIQWDAMIAKVIEDDQAISYFREWLPVEADSTERQKNRIREVHNELMVLFGGGAKGYETAGRTVWGALNSATEYVDHHAYYRNAETRMESAMWGNGAEQKRRAESLAIELCETV